MPDESSGLSLHRQWLGQMNGDLFDPIYIQGSGLSDLPGKRIGPEAKTARNLNGLANHPTPHP
jgi:hypothetical protein